MAAVLARVKKLPTGETDSFTDTAGSWARGAIGAVQEAGIISGYPDRTYRPKAALNRAEMVTLINRMLKRGPLTGVSNPTWPDVDSNHWAFEDIEEASADHDYFMDKNTEIWTDGNRK